MEKRKPAYRERKKMEKVAENSHRGYLTLLENERPSKFMKTFYFTFLVRSVWTCSIIQSLTGPTITLYKLHFPCAKLI